MACRAHAVHVDLRFGDAARELLGFRVSAGPGDLTRKHLHLLRQCWSGTNWKAERMARLCSNKMDGPVRIPRTRRSRALCVFVRRTERVA
jgi:hypothetical protein